MSIHISAARHQIAPCVIITDDPQQTRLIAQKLLTKPQLVSDIRNALVYTGTFQQVPVSLVTVGIGISSLAIYVEELVTYYHVQAIISVATAQFMQTTHTLPNLAALLVRSAGTDFNLWADSTNYPVANADLTLNQVVFQTAGRDFAQLKLQVGNVYTKLFAPISAIAPTNLTTTHQFPTLDAIDLTSYGLLGLGTKLGCATACLLSADLTQSTTARASAISTNLFKLSLTSLVTFYQRYIQPT